MNGCSHGELDTLYATIEDIGKKTGKPIDLFISCGDFQAMRNVDDLHCFAAPPKYRAMKDFHQYYSGAKVAPVPTIFGELLCVSMTTLLLSSARFQLAACVCSAELLVRLSGLLASCAFVRGSGVGR